MRVHPVTLAVVIGAHLVVIACLVVDHSQAGAVIALLGTVAAGAAPALVSASVKAEVAP